MERMCQRCGTSEKSSVYRTREGAIQVQWWWLSSEDTSESFTPHRRSILCERCVKMFVDMWDKFMMRPV